MAKISRENRLRERKADKRARKEQRRTSTEPVDGDGAETQAQPGEADQAPD